MGTHYQRVISLIHDSGSEPGCDWSLQMMDEAFRGGIYLLSATPTSSLVAV